MKNLFPKGVLEMKSAYLKGWIGFVVLLSVMFVVGCATTGPPLFGAKADRPGLMPAGSSWVYEYRDSGSFGSGTMLMTTKSHGEQTWQGKKVYAYENPENTLLLDATTNKWVAILKGSTPIMIYNPPLGWDYPIWVGKTWTQVHNITLPNRTNTVDAHWKVEAMEEIRVPAGTFKVFRINYSDRFNEIISWWSPDLGIFVKSKSQRKAESSLGQGIREAELYSHDIKK
jgi:hypothetical protein